VHYGDGWIPLAGRGDIMVAMAKFRAMLKEAGRDPATCPITLFDCADDADTLKRYRDQPAGSDGRRLAGGPRPLCGPDPSGQRLKVRIWNRR
jgi:hypothetical protein